MFSARNTGLAESETGVAPDFLLRSSGDTLSYPDLAPFACPRLLQFGQSCVTREALSARRGDFSDACSLRQSRSTAHIGKRQAFKGASVHTVCRLLRFVWSCSNPAPVRWTPYL